MLTGLSYTQPLLFVFLVVGFAGLVTRWKSSKGLVAVSLAGIFLISWPPVEWLLALPLEYPYRTMLQPGVTAGAIVVLSGSGDPAHPDLPVAIPGSGSYARSRYAAWLYHNWRSVPIFVSGGSPARGRPSVASLMAHTLRSEGVPPANIVAENASTNTSENARFTASLLRKASVRDIVLVVDADSMLRADLCFRKEGLNVVPAPFGHRSLYPPGLMPSWGAIRGNESTLHEALGLVWYKLRGWI